MKAFVEQFCSLAGGSSASHIDAAAVFLGQPERDRTQVEQRIHDRLDVDLRGFVLFVCDAGLYAIAALLIFIAFPATTLAGWHIDKLGAIDSQALQETVVDVGRNPSGSNAEPYVVNPDTRGLHGLQETNIAGVIRPRGTGDRKFLAHIAGQILLAGKDVACLGIAHSDFLREELGFHLLGGLADQLANKLRVHAPPPAKAYAVSVFERFSTGRLAARSHDAPGKDVGLRVGFLLGAVDFLCKLFVAYA